MMHSTVRDLLAGKNFVKLRQDHSSNKKNTTAIGMHVWFFSQDLSATGLRLGLFESNVHVVVPLSLSCTVVDIGARRLMKFSISL